MGVVCKECNNYMKGKGIPVRCPVCGKYQSYEETEDQRAVNYICLKCGTRTQRLDSVENDNEKCYACAEYPALVKLDISKVDVLVAGMKHIESESKDDYPMFGLDDLEEKLILYFDLDAVFLDKFTKAVEKAEKEGLLKMIQMAVFNL